MNNNKSCKHNNKLAISHYHQYLLWLILIISSPFVQASGKLIYSVDFTDKPDGNARPWLEKSGYEMQLDSDDIEITFKNKQLNLATNEQKAGIFGLKLKPGKYLDSVSRIDIEWGVIKQPKGANWEAGNNRVPIAFMFFFGTDEISSGLPFGINPSPYFLSPFIGLKEKPGKVYQGKLYKEGGRYICLAVTTGSNEVIKSSFKIDPRFLNIYKKDKIPPITGIAFQMNTEDTEGGAHAFVRKLEFYSK